MKDWSIKKLRDERKKSTSRNHYRSEAAQKAISDKEAENGFQHVWNQLKLVFTD
jgi:hypothetical protein